MGDGEAARERSTTPPERLDVGFVPVEVPGLDGTGATYTAALLIRELSKHHDLTVYVVSQRNADRSQLPATDRVDYVVRDDLPKLPHPLLTKVDVVEGLTDRLERHDLVHSYSTGFIDPLSTLSIPTVVTLNSYQPVCPKGDMMWMDREKCGGPSRAKCAACIAGSAYTRKSGVETTLRSSYDSLAKVEFVQKSIDAREGISAYHLLSPHQRDDYTEFGFSEERLKVIPHFDSGEFAVSDPAAYKRGGDPDLGRSDDDPFTLLAVGAFKYVKGFQVLLRALPSILDDGHDVRVRIAGAGPYGGALRSISTDLGVDDHVDWLGFVDHDDLPSEYAAADAFVYPGLLDEPFGRVFLEALSSGTPVLSSDVGSTDFIVGDAGVRFEADDPESLARAFGRLRDEYDGYREAIPGQLARFSRGRVVEEFLSLYADVRAGRPPNDRTKTFETERTVARSG
ncbi:glycosyltransferase family 4 protein [Haloprofundus halobius]|uniref:glycosyltransferase family 4 protein n=1 Tax=Haloprofundus halobius TaxID=2876194 RepID=UPI001CCCCD95|nr:glycosyltransferase family 4 protein [Haloprofundus halobius]